MTVLELRAVERTHRSGETVVHALRGVDLTVAAGELVLRQLRARCEAGAAGVLVTHEARHAAWADRVVFLRDGAMVDDTGHATPVEALLERSAP